jgi:LacI family transcriptional regulator
MKRRAQHGSLNQVGLTIQEVAREAGVSTSTVSRALNNTGQVSLGTRKMVLSVVRELGYVPNAHARHLALSKRRKIGMIVSDVSNPFSSRVSRRAPPSSVTK